MLKILNLAIFLALLAPALCADSVGYIDENKEAKWENSVEITAWSWKQVDYKAEGKAKTVPRSKLLGVTRSVDNGTMSQELSNAIQNMAASFDDAKAGLEDEVKAGSALNKEEAKFRLGQLFAGDANNAQAAKLAVARLKDYLKDYSQGFFAGEAYPLLARMQAQAADITGARQTYRDMGKILGAPYDLRGLQALGELEMSLKTPDFDAALAAFRDAGKAAGADKSAKIKADAWISLVLCMQKKLNEAKPIAEAIAKDDSINDERSADDEVALCLANRVLGDCLYNEKSYEKAYDAYMLASFYAWWAGGTSEGYCLAQAWLAATELESTDEKFKARREKLEDALNAGYPNEFKAAKDKKKK